MPLYYFKCSHCGKTSRRILKPEEVAGQTCTCGAFTTRDPQPPTTRVVETLDNGVMTRPVERLADAERLFKERNEATKRSQGQ